MDIIIIVLGIIHVILLIGLVLIVLLQKRNSEVSNFRQKILNLTHIKATILIRIGQYEDANSIWDIYDKYTYNEMLYSKKALKLENWFTAEEIERLKSE